MTVAQLVRQMTSAELTEWIAFYRIEPFGCAIDDYRAGLYASMKANAARDGKPPLSPLDLYPWHAEPEEAPDPMKVIELFEQAAREEKLRG